MMELEDKTEQIADLKDELAKQKNLLTEFKQEYNNREKKLKQKLAEIKKEKKEIENELEPKILEQYQNLYDNKHKKAVAKVEDGYCMGCRMSLAFDLIDKVKSGERILTCENCKRILYFDN